MTRELRERDELTLEQANDMAKRIEVSLGLAFLRIFV
jgi:hypothetical protein